MAATLLVSSLFAFAPAARTPASRVVARASTLGPARARPLSSTIGDDIKSIVGSNDVVVFSKTTCPFCARTKGLFRDVLQVDTKVVELDQLDNGAEYQDELLTITGQRTVPNVFVKGSHLGGCDDTMKANDSGKLAEMLGL